jgi:hypothetical protein
MLFQRLNFLGRVISEVEILMFASKKEKEKAPQVTKDQV